MSRWIHFAVAALTLTGCMGSERDRSFAPAAIDACPAGGTLRITLWDVYATPRRPDGDVWDGVSSDTTELVCAITAEEIRARVRDAAIAQLGAAGAAGDALVGDAFESTVAETCGLAANWLQMRYEGPDLAAFGAFASDTEWRWETVQVEDTWAARLNTTTTGAPAAWEIPCDATGFVAEVMAVDRDITFDDPLGTIGLDFTFLDDAICRGWGYYDGVDGIAGVLVRLDVVGASPVCP